MWKFCIYYPYDALPKFYVNPFSPVTQNPKYPLPINHLCSVCRYRFESNSNNTLQCLFIVPRQPRCHLSTPQSILLGFETGPYWTCGLSRLIFLLVEQIIFLCRHYSFLWCGHQYKILTYYSFISVCVFKI